MLLTNANQLSDHTKGYIENNISYSYVLGGTKSISSSVFNKMDEVITPIRNIERVETFGDVEVEFGGEYKLPGKVEIGLSDKVVITVPVEWYDKDVNINIPGVYKVEGNLDLSGVRNLEEEAKKKKATINIVVAEKIEVDKKPFRVVVDYGHGGDDPGAVYNGRREKDDTLRLGRLVTTELKRQGIVVEETRTGDHTVELVERSRFANRNGRDYYDYFISIHRNAFRPNTAQGSETFVYMTRNPLSVALATNIQKGLTNVGFTDRGVKEGNFYVLRATYAPAVLVEVGFMDSDSDNKLFDNNIEQIAKSIADAVILQSK